MSNMTIFKDADINLTVVDGVPPVDQTALVATLQGQVASLQAKIDAARLAAQATKDRDAARVEGQDILDALS